ncbi:MAG: hypothetical protein JKY13_03925 [Gammaproteobacteria bacterium]|nr:hypothetical protein [Gammaproteobacteria bacterium]
MLGISAIEFRLRVIRPTLQRIDLWSEASENLLLGTAAQESQLGYYLAQEQGPALGIYQIKPSTHRKLWNNYINRCNKLVDQIKGFLPTNCHTLEMMDNELITNLAYATVIARLIYQQADVPLPKAHNVESLARYWQRYYKLSLDEDCINNFIYNYQQYVLFANF